jgi:hypothetical protein
MKQHCAQFGFPSATKRRDHEFAHSECHNAGTVLDVPRYRQIEKLIDDPARHSAE